MRWDGSCSPWELPTPQPLPPRYWCPFPGAHVPLPGAAEPSVSTEGTPGQGQARWPSLPRGVTSPLLQDLQAVGHTRMGPASYSEL